MALPTLPANFPPNTPVLFLFLLVLFTLLFLCVLRHKAEERSSEQGLGNASFRGEAMAGPKDLTPWQHEKVVYLILCRRRKSEDTSAQLSSIEEDHTESHTGDLPNRITLKLSCVIWGCCFLHLGGLKDLVQGVCRSQVITPMVELPDDDESGFQLALEPEPLPPTLAESAWTPSPLRPKQLSFSPSPTLGKILGLTLERSCVTLCALYLARVTIPR